MRRTHAGVLVTVLLGSVAACGGGGASTASSSEFDCPVVEFIVPYEPGGGSDRQVRRLQPHLEKSLDTRINITYQPGGDGAAGWQSLDAAEPDGCTVANVVAPNIILLSESGDVGFAYDKFEYIAWTEWTPNVLTVSAKSDYKTVEDFITAAKSDPGGLTVAGVGEVGKLLVEQVEAATGMKVSYVPVTGGVGDIVPEIQGGHVDAGMIGLAHVVEGGGSLRGLASSGTKPSPELPEVPTFSSRGFSGVTLPTTWGVIAPPNTPDAIMKDWNDAISKAMSSEKTLTELRKSGLTPLQQSPSEAQAYLSDRVKDLEKARSKFG
ncbi:MAG: tripartite tricarboxylate transporter substrate binding protein [Actinomycetes bacterium]